MGMDINAKLIYGIRYSEIPEDIRDEVDELIDDDKLDYASPWYDAEREGWIVGLQVYCNGANILDLKDDVEDLYTQLPESFKKLEMRLYVSPDVY